MAQLRIEFAHRSFDHAGPLGRQMFIANFSAGRIRIAKNRDFSRLALAGQRAAPQAAGHATPPSVSLVPRPKIKNEAARLGGLRRDQRLVSSDCQRLFADELVARRRGIDMPYRESRCRPCRPRANPAASSLVILPTLPSSSGISTTVVSIASIRRWRRGAASKACPPPAPALRLLTSSRYSSALTRETGAAHTNHRLRASRR